ncbi:MAG: hypothetical protein AAGA96_12880 [Verrucomicrobiota bacterium]
MSATLQRDQASALAKSNPKQALAKAKAISEPWFRAQALAWVARFTDSDPVPIAKLAAKAASKCDDDYKRSAVRAWEVAALAERNESKQAERALKAAVAMAEAVQPVSSRSEALFLLFQAAFPVGRKQAEWVCARLDATCPEAEHWRCKRSRRDAHQILEGMSEARPFFW